MRLWALVLDARSIPCLIERDGAGWLLLVPAEYHDRAREQLERFEEENRNWPPLPPPAGRSFPPLLSTLSILLALAAFYNITVLTTDPHDLLPLDWVEAGCAYAARIRDGEWWRLATALTLHRDLPHLLGNLAFGGLFVHLLCREVGSGAAWSIAVASGILGNLANALLQSPDHRSLGASTAVFGAVGALSALSAASMASRHRRLRGWPLPLAAALSLLTILGTEGRQTDLGAHLFGFLAGVGLGGAAVPLLARRGSPGRFLNGLLASLALLAVCGAWLWALQAG